VLDELAGCSHDICGQPGWDEVAADALDWTLEPRDVHDGL
jgi:hypothetical protein